MKKFNSKIVFTALAVLLTASCTNVEDVYIETPTSDVIYSETFQNGLGDFKAVNVLGDQVWTYNSSGYAIMTGYENSTNYANEDWLISPEIDLTNIASAYFSFDYAMRYSNDPANDATVWILADQAYSPDTLPNASQWVKLDLKPFVDPGSWTFSNSNDISLNDYVGKKIRIAFRFISSATKAGTWEIKNFIVKKGNATVNTELIYSNPFGSGIGDFTTQMFWEIKFGIFLANMPLWLYLVTQKQIMPMKTGSFLRK